MAKIAILGCGVVGSGVYNVLTMNKEVIAKRCGEEVEVKKILDLKEYPDKPYGKLIVHDIEEILNDEEISVVVETMGGIEPAHTFVKKALEAGKSVCSSNKAIIADFGTEFLSIAKEKNVRILFGAAVGGGIPIIRPIKEALSADQIESITGILNGTTNYILTKMSVEGAEFEDALKEAQDNGYAERDPSADIEGFDPCRKIAILASLVTGKNVHFETIHTEGITNISSKDFAYTDKIGAKIKLFAQFNLKDGRLSAITAPFVVSSNNPLFAIDDVINAVCIHGNAVDDVVFQGAGAGSMPTASAVAADVIDAIRHSEVKDNDLWDDTPLIPEDFNEYEFKYFARTEVANKANVEAAFGPVDFIQVDSQPEEIAFITKIMKEKTFKEAKEKVALLNYVRVSPDKI